MAPSRDKILFMTRLCIVPRVDGPGGMSSFRLKFEEGLRRRNIEVTHDLSLPSDALLVIAGTRDLPGLWRARRRGIRIVQRLDGINWVQRVRWTGFRYHLRAEYGNALLALIRSRFADRVVYQSQFIRGWWEKWYGVASVPATVILNGVDLAAYTAEGSEQPPSAVCRIMLLEGSMVGGLNSGLFHAIQLAGRISQSFPVELRVAGRVDESTKKKALRETSVPLQFFGTVPREQVPSLARSSHMLYCAEVNPPCPNSVIEALACGLPVIGFDTGSLSELVAGDAGRLVPYGADPWKLQQPDIPALAQAAQDVFYNQPRFRQAARGRAEALLSVEPMVDAYLRVLLED
jgi:glycosyltransferase involved in cell wall biosynthesis